LSSFEGLAFFVVSVLTIINSAVFSESELVDVLSVLSSVVFLFFSLVNNDSFLIPNALKSPFSVSVFLKAFLLLIFNSSLSSSSLTA